MMSATLSQFHLRFKLIYEVVSRYEGYATKDTPTPNFVCEPTAAAYKSSC